MTVKNALNFYNWLIILHAHNYYSSYMPATPLLSAQIFGVTDIVEQLKTAPIQIVTTLDSNNLTMREFMCVFWNENNK